MTCPRCGAAVAPEQDWCLQCGFAARTRLAPTPRWKIPVAVVATVAAAALAALAVAFVDLTADPEPTAAPATTAPPATRPPTATTPPPGGPPATTGVPPAGSTSGGATAP